RACVALFWERPYKHKLIEWGHSLHDRFMLPHFLWRDLTDVLQFLADNGYPFKSQWYESFLEFRCPRVGTMELEGVELE
ncbi:transglutaminase family protein, partial [Vibrio sp. 404]